MPIVTRWFEPSAVIQVFKGRVDDHDLSESYHQVLGDRRFDDLRFHVIDLSAAASVRVSDARLEEIAAHVHGASFSNSRLRVLVISPDPDVVALLQRFALPGLNAYPTTLVRSHLVANHLLVSWSAGVRHAEQGQWVPARMSTLPPGLA